MYPALPVLNRICNNDYNIPGTDIVIEKGTAIIIPTEAIHNDEKYYTDPDTFIPDRFLPKNKSQKSSLEMPYYPFGDGPRNCIGMRFGKIQTKVGIAAILGKFNFELTTHEKLVMSPRALLMLPIGGIKLKISNRVKSIHIHKNIFSISANI